MKIAATMELNSGKERQLFDYLLGLLPDAELEEIEQRVFDDPDFASELEAAETDLLDAWASDRLSADDRELFETQYRTGSPRRESRLAFANALSQVQRERLASTIAPSPSFWQRLWTGFQPDFRLVAAAACSILLIATLGVWRLGTQSVPLPPPQIQVAKQPQPADPTPQIVARAQPPVPQFRLAPGLDRSSKSTVIRVPGGAREIALRLAMDTGQKRPPIAILESLEGNILLRQRTHLTSAREARLTLPAKVLTPGEYLVRLAGSEGEAIAEYIFEIR